MSRATARLDPALVYYVLKCGHAFLFTLITTVALVFQTGEAGLTPIQLLLVGAGLQGAILLSETPTGVVADTYGRKRSVLIGLLLMGSGAIIGGSVAEFGPILIGNIVYGLGTTFMSGAAEAWIADEVGIDRASRVYLRSAQLTKVFWIAAIPVATVIASHDLNLPILIAGVCFFFLVAYLFLTMRETGFHPAARPEVNDAWRSVGHTFVEARGLVRASPLLLTIFVIMAFYGMAGQGFERLWVAFFFETQSFPALGDFEPIIWFGAIRMAAALLSILAVEVIRRWLAAGMTNHMVVTRTLFWINSLQMLSILGLAVSGEFLVAAACFCAAIALAECYDPFYLAWVNQNVESRVRATVISMSSQFEALGKTLGGPLIGVVAAQVTLRSAIAVAGLSILPALLFYFRAFGQGPQAEAEPENAS